MLPVSPSAAGYSHLWSRRTSQTFAWVGRRQGRSWFHLRRADGQDLRLWENRGWLRLGGRGSGRLWRQLRGAGAGGWQGGCRRGLRGARTLPQCHWRGDFLLVDLFSLLGRGQHVLQHLEGTCTVVKPSVTPVFLYLCEKRNLRACRDSSKGAGGGKTQHLPKNSTQTWAVCWGFLTGWESSPQLYKLLIPPPKISSAASSPSPCERAAASL